MNREYKYFLEIAFELELVHHATWFFMKLIEIRILINIKIKEAM